MVGVLQSGVVLDVSGVSTSSRETRLAGAALRKLTGRSFGDDPRKWVAWYRATSRAR